MSNQQQFEMAVMLCSVAEELDYAKNTFSPCLRDYAVIVLEFMHKLAEELAGERAAEIFGNVEPDGSAIRNPHSTIRNQLEVQP